MKWEKLGKIFDPTVAENVPGIFAQSPQVLVFDEFVRIYFSTRVTDPKNGKYLSHVAYIEMDKSFRKILKRSDQPVIALGVPGSFDEHGIFPINLVRNGNEVWAYTCGWSRRVSVSVETGIGLAISTNEGVSFEKAGPGPVLTASMQEPFLVGDAFVYRESEGWHMWYIFGTKWIDSREEETARVYKIGYAYSTNGIEWIKAGRQILTDKLNENECQALPTVIFFAGRYHMYFCYREAIGFRQQKGRGYRLGYAWSDDLENWVRADENAGIGLSEAGWDSEMMCYPHVFHCDNDIYMLYNGNEFGKYGFGLARLTK